jgi:catechol 2,3-dioxygenase-like lactoylglutathione lyase family enzyme
MITDLGHTAFRCHDLDKSLAFYALLDIKESFRLHRDDGSLMLVYLHIGGDRFIELFPAGPEPVDPKGSFMHLCLVSDNIQADVEHLRSQGVEIWREIKEGKDGNLQAWIKDPDQNPIELMQLAENSPQRRVARGEKAGSLAS